MQIYVENVWKVRREACYFSIDFVYANVVYLIQLLGSTTYSRLTSSDLGC